MIIEKFDNGYISMSMDDENVVEMYVNNDFQDVPEWNRCIQVLSKNFSNKENARRFFFNLKAIVEFEE